jgi:hypothetical protein
MRSGIGDRKLKILDTGCYGSTLQVAGYRVSSPLLGEGRVRGKVFVI